MGSSRLKPEKSKRAAFVDLTVTVKVKERSRAPQIIAGSTSFYNMGRGAEDCSEIPADIMWNTEYDVGIRNNI